MPLTCFAALAPLRVQKPTFCLPLPAGLGLLDMPDCHREKRPLQLAVALLALLWLSAAPAGASEELDVADSEVVTRQPDSKAGRAKRRGTDVLRG